MIKMTVRTVFSAWRPLRIKRRTWLRYERNGKKEQRAKGASGVKIGTYDNA